MSQTKQIAVRVYGTKALRPFRRALPVDLPTSSLSSTASEFMSIQPKFAEYESAELDEVCEFRAEISSFPTAHVTWLKDGVPLSDMTAGISTVLQPLSETR